MRDELILAVARSANLPAEQAALVVATVLRFLTARLPSSLVGELHARMGTPPPENEKPLLSGLTQGHCHDD